MWDIGATQRWLVVLHVSKLYIEHGDHRKNQHAEHRDKVHFYFLEGLNRSRALVISTLVTFKNVTKHHRNNGKKHHAGVDQYGPDALVQNPSE